MAVGRQNYMSFKIDSGLFKLDFTDHHAVLGIPVDADFNAIRKRYLQIARRLHPDSCAADSADKQRASQLLSKIVNPAYEKFSKDGNRAEYLVLLREMSKRLRQEASKIELKHELSKQLAQSHNIGHFYKTSLQQLAEKQYESFDQALEIIGQISELNLVYLLRQGGNIAPSSPVATSKATPGETPPTQLPLQPESPAEQYYRRAQALMAKNNFAQARVELQDALKIEPNNSLYHSLMGVVYLRQNQTTMAKVHINKALQLNPQDSMALKAKKFLEAGGQKSGMPQPPSPTSSKSPPGKQSQGGGGMFGGLFGGKK